MFYAALNFSSNCMYLHSECIHYEFVESVSSILYSNFYFSIRNDKIHNLEKKGHFTLE